MLQHCRSSVLTIVGLAWFASLSFASLSFAQSVHPGAAMHWRHIGPTRAGRARAVAGVASQPNVSYIGFDNGGVWRSTDYGSNWKPIFDSESTGSIGAIAVAPSDPNVIYVGTGAGIIRPDLATGNGVYKSTDAGKTWTHLGLADSQMIAHIDVVAARSEPVLRRRARPPVRPERGARHLPLDRRRQDLREGALQGRVHERRTTCASIPPIPNVVYAALWQQQQSFIEGGGFGGARAEHRRHLQVHRRRHDVEAADRGAAQRRPGEHRGRVEQPKVALRDGGGRRAWRRGRGGRGGRGGGGGVGLYKSTDGGEHWFLAVRGPDGAARATPDPRPLARIGGGDLPTDRRRSQESERRLQLLHVFWRTEDGGLTWSAVRGAPGGDDYQKMWINPNDTDILVVGRRPGGRGLRRTAA